MTTLIEEEPYAVAINEMYVKQYCAKCLKKSESLLACAACKKTCYCDRNCQKGDWADHKAAAIIPSHHVRVISRMIHRHKRNPNFQAFNGRTYEHLLDHYDAHMGIQCKSSIVKMAYGLVSSYMGQDTPDYKTTCSAIWKKAINGFEIHDETGLGLHAVAVYLGLSVLDHSCKPDCYTTFKGANFVLKIAEKKVYSNQLTISYLSSGFPKTRKLRRLKLLCDFLFDCMCEFCRDDQLNEKQTSGRPECCRNSWFSKEHPFCHRCGKAVCEDRLKKLENSNEALSNKLQKLMFLQAIFTTAECHELFNKHKENLSDYNHHLLELAHFYCEISLGVKCASFDRNFNNQDRQDIKMIEDYMKFWVPVARNDCDQNLRVNTSCLVLLLLKCQSLLAMKRTNVIKREALKEMEILKTILGDDHDIHLHYRKMFNGIL